MQAHRGAVRVGLVALGGAQLAIGSWALLDTHGWFDSFPGAGHHWLAAYGAYNAHLAVDVGATFSALGALLLLAAVWMEKRVVQAALIAYLVYAVPHLVYHLGADDTLPTGDRITSDASLVLSVVAPLVLLWTVGRADTAAPAARPAGDGASRIAPRHKGFGRLISFYSRIFYGTDTTPGGLFAHHPAIAIGYGTMEFVVDHTHRVDDKLKDLAAIRAAQIVNCEWCMDFGSKVGRDHGVTDQQLTEMGHYRESGAFSSLEKLVLDYATAASRSPAEVSDGLFARLAKRFDEAQLVELTTAIAIENFRARFNHATGVAAEGFSEGMVCVLPDQTEAARAPG